MARRFFTIGLVFAAVLTFSPVWAGTNMNTGKWEITTRMEMPGIPTQAVTHVQCITEEDMVPKGDNENKDCRMEQMDISGDTVTWKMVCTTEEGEMTGTGKVTYSGDTMEGAMQMTITGEANMTINSTLSGRRLGDCDGTEASAQPNFTPTPATGTTGSAVGGAIADDVGEIGQAARDEAKQATIDEVRTGVGNTLRGLFK